MDAIKNALPGTRLKVAGAAINQMRMSKGYRRFRSKEDILLAGAVARDSQDDIVKMMTEMIDELAKKGTSK